MILGWMPMLEKAIYVIVALAAIYLAIITPNPSK